MTSLDLDRTLDFDFYSLGGIPDNLNNFTPNQLIFTKL